MTIADLIRELQQFAPETKVLKFRDHGNGDYHWDTMDGHWFRLVDVVPDSGVINNGRYYDATRGNAAEAIEALEL